MSKIITIDIDGTLCINGEPNKPLVNIMRMYKKSQYIIIIATGRNNENREWTVKWLKKNKIPYDELLMKPDDRQDERTRDWKEEAIKEYLESRKLEPSNIEVGFENHWKTGKMWAGLGVPTFIVYGEDD